MHAPGVCSGARASSVSQTKSSAVVVSLAILAYVIGPVALHISSGPEDDIPQDDDYLTMLQKTVTKHKHGAVADSLRLGDARQTAQMHSAVKASTKTFSELLSRIKEDPRGTWKEQRHVALVHGVGTAALFLLCAILYRRVREPPTSPGDIMTSKTWKYGLWELGDFHQQDCNICLMAFLCLPIRWADTVSQDKMNAPGGLGWSFWPAVITFTVLLSVLGYATCGVSVCVLFLLQVYYRQKIREAFGLEPWTLQHLFSDCMVWCCCCPCAALQEARQVEGVRRDECAELFSTPVEQSTLSPEPVVLVDQPRADRYFLDAFRSEGTGSSEGTRSFYVVEYESSYALAAHLLPVTAEEGRAAIAQFGSRTFRQGIWGFDREAALSHLTPVRAGDGGVIGLIVPKDIGKATPPINFISAIYSATPRVAGMASTMQHEGVELYPWATATTLILEGTSIQTVVELATSPTSFEKYGTLKITAFNSNLLHSGVLGLEDGTPVAEFSRAGTHTKYTVASGVDASLFIAAHVATVKNIRDSDQRGK